MQINFAIIFEKIANEILLNYFDIKNREIKYT